jgi:hypothetical protein
MSIVSGFIDLFRTPSPERQKQKHLAVAKLALEEAEIGVEDYTAQREKLKLRVQRLEADLITEDRPARSSVQAPHPGPVRFTVGAAEMQEPRMRGLSKHASA